MDWFDQTQAITFDDDSDDDTDELGDPFNKQPVGQLKVFNQKSLKETNFPVYEGDNQIGRHPNSQICIPLKALSKNHACIEIQGKSHLIYDLESRNKTRKGKLTLKPSVRYELQDGDTVIFGDVKCQYQHVEVQQKSTPQAGNESDSETGSESMLLEMQPAVEETTAGNKASTHRSATVGQSNCDPTQAVVDECEEKTILETPQRDDGTFVFAECSDDIQPAATIKSDVDSDDIDFKKQMLDEPTQAFLNEDEEEMDGADREPLRRTNACPSELEPTLMYEDIKCPDVDYTELATQAFGSRTVDETDDESENDAGGPRDGDRMVAYTELPTQVYGSTGESDGECEGETDRPQNGVRNNEITKAFTELATQAYCADTDVEDEDESGEGMDRPQDDQNDKKIRVLTELATQAYCADTDVEDEDESGEGMDRPQDDQNDEKIRVLTELATQAYCDDDTDVEDEDKSGVPNVQSATVTYCADTDEEMMDISAIAATQAYISDSDDEKAKQMVDRPITGRLDVVIDQSGMDTQAYASDSDNERIQQNVDRPIAREFDTAVDQSETETQVYAPDSSNHDDVSMVSEINVDVVDCAQLATRPAEGVMDSAGTVEENNHCDAPTLRYSLDSDLDAIGKTQQYSNDNNPPVATATGGSSPHRGVAKCQETSRQIEQRGTDVGKVVITDALVAETQVPSSQEEEEEAAKGCPLPGIARIPLHSVLASPDRSRPQKDRRVAFVEKDSPEEVPPSSRRSARGRKPKTIIDLPSPVATETDCGLTRKKSKKLQLAGEDKKKPVAKRKPKGKGAGVAEGDGPGKKSAGQRAKADDVNNNEADAKGGLRSARQSLKRKVSYRFPICGSSSSESDDTESLSSTSSWQLLDAATVCDGPTVNKRAAEPRGRKNCRGKRKMSVDAKKTREDEHKQTATSEAGGRSVPAAGKRQTKSAKGNATAAEVIIPVSKRRSVARNSAIDDVVASTRPSTTRGRRQSTRQAESQGKETAGRRGRSGASEQGQSFITDYAVVGPTGGSAEPSSSSGDAARKTSKRRSRNTTASPPIIERDAEVRVSTRARRSTSVSPQPDAHGNNGFVAPGPVKRGRPRRGVKEELDPVGSATEGPGVSGKAVENAAGKGKGKRGRKTPPPKEPKEQQVPVPPTTTTGRARKRSTSDNQTTTPTQSPAKTTRECPGTPDGERASPLLRRRSIEAKPKVMFTGVIDTAWQKIVKSLGGELVENVFECTHLVTDKVRRTVKFLCCLSRGAMIVLPDWLDRCKVRRSFVDTAEFLVKDKAAEKQHGFSLLASHQRVLQQGSVLKDYRVFVTGNVKPERAQMREIILCAGGKFLTNLPTKPAPTTVIISCMADEARCLAAVRAGVRVVSAEFILTGMLRQEVNPQLYLPQDQVRAP